MSLAAILQSGKKEQKFVASFTEHNRTKGEEGGTHTHNTHTTHHTPFRNPAIPCFCLLDFFDRKKIKGIILPQVYERESHTKFGHQSQQQKPPWDTERRRCVRGNEKKTHNQKREKEQMMLFCFSPLSPAHTTQLRQKREQKSTSHKKMTFQLFHGSTSCFVCVCCESGMHCDRLGHDFFVSLFYF